MSVAAYAWLGLNLLFVALSLVVSLKLLPRLLRVTAKIDVVAEIQKGNKAAGYYYVFAGLFASGILMFTTRGIVVPAVLDGEAVASALRVGLVGLVLGFLISYGLLMFVERLTRPLNEWQGIPQGNEAMGLFFVLVGIVIAAILYTISTSIPPGLLDPLSP
ncbi:MAG: DUF350 domain-containing protein [Euryarchaeota archaeon]|nr:DUF350 domain-containing protein [Euryarchaeota archaeon]